MAFGNVLSALLGKITYGQHSLFFWGRVVGPHLGACRDLSSLTRIEPTPSVVEMQSLNH